jgi:apolipoprotein N-acyltransferase
MINASMTLPTWEPDTLRAHQAASRFHWLRLFFSGLLLPLSFAPFHFPGLAVLSIALLFLQLHQSIPKYTFLTGFVFGLGFLGFGVSWIYVSIHEFGHLNPLVALGITLLFITYLSLYLGFVTLIYSLLLRHRAPTLFSALLFSSLWCLGEYLRATIIGGFPWLMLGFGQMDSPLQHLFPLMGVYGVSWFTCFIGCVLALSIRAKGLNRTRICALFISLLLTPLVLSHKTWTEPHGQPMSIGIIQANLSMRDKWDETLFWQILDNYQEKTLRLLKTVQLIVLPESAIPLPSTYVNDVLDFLDQQAKQSHRSILLGIPYPTKRNNAIYYNAILGLGQAEGLYFKQHLVAFGEFTPSFLSSLSRWLDIPLSNLAPGKSNQPLIQVDHHPIASLICYELAFPELLRRQLPDAEWIVSISDDGWFGHSLAVYQHLQMAQVISKQTGRFQIVSNNDGLSSVIDATGKITSELPAFDAGLLTSSIQPFMGASPWVIFGDAPFYFFIVMIILLGLMHRFKPKKAS